MFSPEKIKPLKMSRATKCIIATTIFFFFFRMTTVICEVEERTNLRTIFDLLVNIGKEYYQSSGTNRPSRLDCPLCDSSVYSYCSDKLLHDACCCLNPYEHQLPYQCRYADCSFLHANSCREHKLITACCCSKLFDKKIP